MTISINHHGIWYNHHIASFLVGQTSKLCAFKHRLMKCLQPGLAWREFSRFFLQGPQVSHEIL